MIAQQCSYTQYMQLFILVSPATGFAIKLHSLSHVSRSLLQLSTQLHISQICHYSSGLCICLTHTYTLSLSHTHTHTHTLLTQLGFKCSILVRILLH